MGDQHPDGAGIEGDKAVGVLPDVVHDTVQPRLSLHQDDHLGHWQDCVTIATRTFATPIFVTSATPIFVTFATPFFRTIATRTFATPL